MSQEYTQEELEKLEEKAFERVATTPALALWNATIFYSWYNWREHLEWVVSASVAEILDWCKTIEEQGE